MVPILGTSDHGRRTAIRLLAALPPLVAGAVIGTLDKIFTITGMFGFAIEFVIPTIMQLLSRRMCVKRWGPGSDSTPFSGWHSHSFWVCLELFVGVAAWIAAVVFTIISWVN